MRPPCGGPLVRCWIFLSLLVFAFVGCDQQKPFPGQVVPGTESFTQLTSIPIYFSPTPVETNFNKVTGIAPESAIKLSQLVMQQFRRLPLDLLRKSKASVMLVGQIEGAAGLAVSKGGLGNPLHTIVIAGTYKVYVRRQGEEGLVDSGKMVTHLPKGVLFHEFFHVLDHEYNEDSSFSAWAKLNPKEFQYVGALNSERFIKDGTRAKSLYRETYQSNPLAFVSSYSTASAWEDRAEIFNFLLEESAISIANSAGSSAVLRSKFWAVDKIVSAISGSMRGLGVGNFSRDTPSRFSVLGGIWTESLNQVSRVLDNDRLEALQLVYERGVLEEPTKVSGAKPICTHEYLPFVAQD